jgi:hypothetical protein
LTILGKLGTNIESFHSVVELNAFAVQFRYDAFELSDEPLDRDASVGEAVSLFKRVSDLTLL